MIDLGSFKMILDKSDISFSREILSLKDYEPHLRAFVERMLKPEMSVIDIGTNIEFYTLMFTLIVEHRGKVFSFEPNYEELPSYSVKLEGERFPPSAASRLRSF
jgi:hypothetical protein